MANDNVLVTGFGPFGEHKINASWEAVKLLPQLSFNGVKIITKQIPVLYKYVDEQVPLLWKTYNPKLVVHVGVSCYAKEITIETQAFRSGYIKEDCENNKHPTGESCCAKNGDNCIQSTLNVDKICATFNNNKKLKACVSSNAGRYLCEFVYYKSLNIDKNRTMFIHVPPINKPYSAEELAEGIAQIIDCALVQVEELCVNDPSTTP